jgi:hypothetical protein
MSYPIRPTYPAHPYKSKSIKIKIYKNIILPAVLDEYET